MTDMQILAGMNELNERVQNEARATEAERQAQATQQELARSQAGVKGKEKGAAVPLQQAQGIGASGRFFGGALNFLNTLRDTATIQQPSWTWRSRH